VVLCLCSGTAATSEKKFPSCPAALCKGTTIRVVRYLTSEANRFEGSPATEYTVHQSTARVFCLFVPVSRVCYPASIGPTWLGFCSSGHDSITRYNLTRTLTLHTGGLGHKYIIKMLVPENITKKDFESTLLRYPALLKAVSASKTGMYVLNSTAAARRGTRAKDLL